MTTINSSAEGKDTQSLPQIALSIRQPWAWLIVNGHKDIENRSWPTRFRGRFLVHAAKGMTRDEYEAAYDHAAVIIPNVPFPTFEALQRGGVVGVSEITDCVQASESPWFTGENGFVLKNSKPIEFIPCKGSLGFFTCFAANALEVAV